MSFACFTSHMSLERNPKRRFLSLMIEANMFRSFGKLEDPLSEG